MKYILLLLTLLFCLSGRTYQTGDIVFIKSQTAQSQALREATGSEWTHVGVYIDGKIAEETGGLKLTDFTAFVSRSKNKEFKVFRHREYTKSLDQKLKSLLSKYNKPYDIYFEWSNDRIYCSEFVYKLYQELIGVGVGRLQTFNDMNLDTPAVKELIKQRYIKNKKPFNFDETIITPVSQMKDENLVDVTSEIYVRGGVTGGG